MYQIDQNMCLCCHNCALECPKEAINYVGTGYQVDGDKCIDCGKCASVCNVSAVKKVGETKEVTPHERIEYETDLLVLGAGAAGIVAAAKAADLTGKKVILLEKAEKYGGSGWFAGFSVPVKEEGKKEDKRPPMPPHMAKAMERIQKELDPGILKMAKEAPSEFFEWFRNLDERVDELWGPQMGPGGMELELKQRSYFNLKNRDKAIGPGRSTSVMEKILTDHFEELGVTLLTGHRAVSIEKNEKGEVCGLLAEDAGGEVHISCKAIISCTGGFANNEALLRKHAPQYYGKDTDEHTHRFAVPSNTGDVMGLGKSAGAYLDEKNFTANVFGPVHHPFSFTLFMVQNQPEVVNVNLDGKRFVNESVFGGGAAKMYHQPGRIAYSIIDSKTKEKIKEKLLHGPDAGVLSLFDQDFEEEAQLDTPLKKADSLEELAELCGIDKEAFLETIKNYNSYCEKGEDPDFGKRPDTLCKIEEGPYYAIFGKLACDGAFGGMLVNSKAEVYNADKSGLIPGLYAAGDNASGWFLKSEEEGDNRLMATNECNWAIASGYTAGISAAEYLGKEE